MFRTAAIASVDRILFVASHVARANLANGAMLMVSVRKIAAYQNASTLSVAPTQSVASLVAHVLPPIRAIPKVNASVLRTALVEFVVLILFVGSLVARANPANGAMLMVSVRKIAAYQNASTLSVAPTQSVASLVAHVLPPIRAIPKVNASVLRTALVEFVVLILYVGSLVVVVLVPRFAAPTVNASVLRTALVAFVVLILCVGSLVVVVAFILTAMMMAGVFPMTTVSNGYESRVELSRWVLMLGTLMKSPFIVLRYQRLR